MATASTSTAALQSQVQSLLARVGGAGALGGGTAAATAPAATTNAATAATGATSTDATSAALLQQTPTTLNVTTLSSTIQSVARFVSERQTYLGHVSTAIAVDAMRNDTPDQAAITKLNMMTDSLKLINDMNKKLQDSLQQSIETWARPQ